MTTLAERQLQLTICIRDTKSILTEFREKIGFIYDQCDDLLKALGYEENTDEYDQEHEKLYASICVITDACYQTGQALQTLQEDLNDLKPGPSISLPANIVKNSN